MGYKKTTTNAESGFTLIEIIISTAIFVTVVAAMLSLFNYTLQINRRVQSLREIVQGSRAFTEVLTREVRNGRIDYSSWTPECAASNYLNNSNQSLSILSKNGDRLCFYHDGTDFYLKKQSPTSLITSKIFDSTNFGIIADTFRFAVSPAIDPNPSSPPYPELQPFVTVVAQFELRGVDTIPTVINYQTTISSDVYDIFNQN